MFFLYLIQYSKGIIFFVRDIMHIRLVRNLIQCIHVARLSFRNVNVSICLSDYIKHDELWSSPRYMVVCINEYIPADVHCRRSNRIKLARENQRLRNSLF